MIIATIIFAPSCRDKSSDWEDLLAQFAQNAIGITIALIFLAFWVIGAQTGVEGLTQYRRWVPAYQFLLGVVLVLDLVVFLAPWCAILLARGRAEAQPSYS
jgi:hypothetical protein